MLIRLPFGTLLTFLLGLLSAVVIVVTFRHLTTVSHSSILLAFIFILLFLALFRGYCRITAIVFAAWVAVRYFKLWPPF